ncbi:tyrosine recombinase XerC [Kribbella sp. NPDC051587]|uniref:tyrosine recombinase XerC n=1 Tax=Kribbella sp. NPDC051587 TaxID=3364119 RepID=UPI00379ACD70
MPIGTAGKIGFLTIRKGRVRARVQFRDYDGVTRAVTRYGSTRAAAERRLKEAVRDRVGPTGGDVTADTKIRDLAEVWRSELMASGLSDGSKQTYERDLDRKILPAMGELTVREARVPRCDAFLTSVRTNSGPGKAKTCKTVLSLLMGLAVRHGAIDTNPVREVSKIPRARSKPKALTTDEESVILTKVRKDDFTGPDGDDVADLMEFLDGTGMRIGEALAVRAEVVDIEAGVIEVNATVVRLVGRGSVLQLRPKTAAGWRIIAVPPHIVELCTRRLARTWPNNPHGLLFPPQLGEARNPSNANRDMKAALIRIDPGFSWVTSHTWRKTVATRLDEAGLTARAIADHLGHAKPSMTQDVYMGRGVASSAAAAALDRSAA